MQSHFIRWLIELFGWFGKLVEVEDLMFNMPIVLDSQVWNKAHGDVIRGLFAMNQVTNMEPEYAAPYTSLSKMYVVGRLDVNGPNKLLLKM